MLPVVRGLVAFLVPYFKALSVASMALPNLLLLHRRDVERSACSARRRVAAGLPPLLPSDVDRPLPVPDLLTLMSYQDHRSIAVGGALTAGHLVMPLVAHVIVLWHLAPDGLRQRPASLVCTALVTHLEDLQCSTALQAHPKISWKTMTPTHSVQTTHRTWHR